jgi:hypothetical protein
MEWTIQDFGALGEFIGGIVVIVTVIYLALQLRTSNSQAEAATELAWTQGLNEIWDRWSRPETIDALRNGFDDFNTLDKNQQVIFQMQVGSLVNHLETAQSLAGRGLLPASYGQVTEDLMVMVLATKGGLQYWEADSKATPNGEERLHMVKAPKRPTPLWSELFPWWEKA